MIAKPDVDGGLIGKRHQKFLKLLIVLSVAGQPGGITVDDRSGWCPCAYTHDDFGQVFGRRESAIGFRGILWDVCVREQGELEYVRFV